MVHRTESRRKTASPIIPDFLDDNVLHEITSGRNDGRSTLIVRFLRSVQVADAGTDDCRNVPDKNGPIMQNYATPMPRNGNLIWTALFCLCFGQTSARAVAAETVCASAKNNSAKVASAHCEKSAQAGPAAGSSAQPSTLIDLRNVSQYRQNLHVPPVASAPLSVHQPDWGVFNRNGATAAGFGPVGRYGAVRWAEDWSVLRNAKLFRKDNDPFDLLKYIPLNPDGSIYLSFSGEERLKNWFENRPGIGTTRPNDSGRMTLRSVYGADLHIGTHVRFYGEVINAAAGGWNAYGYSAGYRTRLDLQQGFGEVQGTVLGAKSGIMLGRMEFIDAPEYVFYLRTVSSVPESWNGGRAFFIWPRIRLDLFDFVQTNINPPAMFHDEPSWNTRLYGAYSSYAVPDFKFLGKPGHAFFDLFYFGYLFNGSAAAIATSTGSQSGSTTRDNIGTRFWGTAGPVEFSLGALYQGGRFNEAKTNLERDVSAYSINTNVGWRFANVDHHPLLGIQADLYSGGNSNRKSGTIGTYTTPYVPQSSYLDTTYYIGTSNVIAVSPVLKASFWNAYVLRVKAPFFWRDSTNDSVYGPSTFYKFKNFSGGFVGATPQASLDISLTRHLRWSHDLGRFFASSSLKKAGASDATYYLSTLSFIF